MKQLITIVGLILITSATSGCASLENSIAKNDEAQLAKANLYRAHMPESILVLPPTNESIEPNASYAYLSTVTLPLAERGYYVYPVAVVDGLMKENGLPHPPEMHSVPLDKLNTIFDADAVMYLHITNFGQKFELLSSDTEVDATAKLIDTETGTQIWANKVAIVLPSSSSGQGGILGSIIEAAITQAITDADAQLYKASLAANTKLFKKLPLGPRHTEFESLNSTTETLSSDAKAGALN